MVFCNIRGFILPLKCECLAYGNYKPDVNASPVLFWVFLVHSIFVFENSNLTWLNAFVSGKGTSVWRMYRKLSYIELAE